MLYGYGGNGVATSKRLKKPLLLNCPPRHLHEVPLLHTKGVVDRGRPSPRRYMRVPEEKILKDGWRNSSTYQRWCLVKNTQGKAMANHPCQCAKKTAMTKIGEGWPRQSLELDELKAQGDKVRLLLLSLT